MRNAPIRGWLWVTLLALPLWVGAAAPDNTGSQYKTTTGQGSPGAVLQQSNDGTNAVPVNNQHPLPVTCSNCSGGSGGSGGGGGVVTQPTANQLNATVVQGAAGTQAWKVDNSGVTQPVSATLLPLPTGAATAAKQPALGTAGTASSDVLTVQGIVNGVPQPISGTVTVANPTTSEVVTQPTGTNLHVVVDSGTITTSGGSGAAANATTNVTQFGGTNVSTGTGTSGAGIPRVTVSSDSFPAVQPVSGTVTTTPSGTQTVAQPTGTNLHTVVDSGTVNVGNFPATQPVSATALPLPSGASTAAKQPALGTAGTASSDVITVQGIANGVAQPVSGTVTANVQGGNATAVKTDGSAVTQPVSGTVSVSNQPTTQVVTQPTGTNLHVVVDSGSIATTGAAANATTNVTQFGGTNVSTGTGTSGAGIPRVTVSSDSFPANQAVTGTVTANVQGGNTTAVKTDGSAVTQPISATTLPLPTGASTAANQTSVQSAAGTSASTLLTVQGAAGGVALPVTVSNFPATQNVNVTNPTTTQTVTQTTGTNLHTVVDGGSITIFAQPQATPSSSTSIALPPSNAYGSSSLILKTAAGNLYDLYATNTTAALVYLMTFNSTTVPADGTVSPIQCLIVPSNTTGGLSFNGIPPESYSTGIVVATSSTGCTTKTAVVVTALHGRAL